MFRIQKQRHFYLPPENNPTKQRDCHLLRLRSRSANDTSEKQRMIGMNDDPSQYCENAPRSTSSNYSFVRFSGFLRRLLHIRRNREFPAKIRSSLISVIWPWNRPRTVQTV